ncbi:hypothetical protein LTR39_000959 [Cryomyces antarcticus]|nr:hypothetical protein LTR39_000959 [Cryomyces antarcticus]
MPQFVRAFTESCPPLGFTHASGVIASSIPTVKDVRTGNYDSNGWSAVAQRRNSLASRRSPSLDASSPVNLNVPVRSLSLGNRGVNAISPQAIQPLAAEEEKTAVTILEISRVAGRTASDFTDQTPESSPVTPPHDPAVPYDNGYQFPPPHSKSKSFQIAMKSFGKWVLTPFGFLITVYALNVVAWGGMLFLVLCTAAPAMCHPSCNDIDSARKKWIEIDSQILNALFCVTGLGLIPWRFGDLYYLLQWRIMKKETGIRRLAGLHNDWFRLEGSQNVPATYDPKSGSVPAGVPDSALALPIPKSPTPPLTGERAGPSAYWKLDFVIWCYVWNTLLQICLCGVMWGLNRFNRPGWTTGLLISVACIVAGVGGWMAFKEGKAVKKVEGVPVSEEDREELLRSHNAEMAKG